MTVALQPQPPHTKRWTKAEYNRFVDCGAFEETDHFYLFRGELIEMSPMQTSHAHSIMKATRLLFSIFDAGQFDIRVQLPFDATGESMPEPNLLVCTVPDGRHLPHPCTAALIIEVADSSLAHDRDKALEYAAAKVPEYWIVNVNARQIEVYRDPIADQAALHGVRYSFSLMVDAGGSISPLANPNGNVKASDLLP